jgi:hypothetical protein
VRCAAFVLASIAAATPQHCYGWGDLGHKVTALIAYRHLSPAARSNLDALLASDPDPLTPPDFAGRATWADKYRSLHRETAAWHFVNVEIAHPDLLSACYNFPALGAVPASQGPALDCVVNKVEQFSAELKDRSTAPAERLLALKFLIHFVGDLHQPLHAADHEDKGGNCIALDAVFAQTANLHAFWDMLAVEGLGPSAQQIADTLDSSLTSAQAKNWQTGGARSWTMEAFAVAKNDAYALPTQPTCQSPGAVTLPAGYQAQAQTDAAIQLLKAGVRMAAMLNAALAP